MRSVPWASLVTGLGVWEERTSCLQQISRVDTDHFYLGLSIDPLPSTPSTPLPDTTTQPPHTPPTPGTTSVPLIGSVLSDLQHP